MENQKSQTRVSNGENQNFYWTGIIIGAASALLSFFCLPAAGIITALAGILLNIKGRKKYRIKIGMVLSVIGLLEAFYYIGMLYYLK